MVEAVKAYRDSSGKVHADYKSAVEADAMIELSAIGAFNHATMLAMIQYAETIRRALSGVALPETDHAQHD